MILSGPRTTWSSPSSADAAPTPQPMASRKRCSLRPLLHERDADATRRDRDDEPAEPGEPADQRLDAATERTGEVEVDRQPEQHADGDEPDADELVLAALDRLAQLGRGLVAPGARHRSGRRRTAARAPAAWPARAAWTRWPARWTSTSALGRCDRRRGCPQVAMPSRYQRGVARPPVPALDGQPRRSPRRRAPCGHVDGRPGRRSSTAPSRSTIDDQLPTARRRHDDAVLHRAVRPPSTSNRSSDDPGSWSRHARGHPQRVERRARSAVKVLPARRLRSLRRSARRRGTATSAPPAPSFERDDQVDQAEVALISKYCCGAAELRPRPPRPPHAIRSTRSIGVPRTAHSRSAQTSPTVVGAGRCVVGLHAPSTPPHADATPSVSGDGERAARRPSRAGSGLHHDRARSSAGAWCAR